MNALTVVDQDPSLKPFADAIAIRMADEGIPVRAIARSVRLPSEDVYEILKEAIGRGSLVELPKDDWPVGTTRGSRGAFNRTSVETDEALKAACARVFRATPLEAALLAVLLRRDQVTKTQLHIVIEQNRPSENREETDPKMVDVMICHLRKKLKLHKIEITTMWGLGYRIETSHRVKAVAMLQPPEELKVICG